MTSVALPRWILLDLENALAGQFADGLVHRLARYRESAREFGHAGGPAGHVGEQTALRRRDLRERRLLDAGHDFGREPIRALEQQLVKILAHTLSIGLTSRIMSPRILVVNLIDDLAPSPPVRSSNEPSWRWFL
ncbi:MAG: hypothetical protein R3E83_04220 [Burkholderiaceae bacterium]